MTNLAAQAMLAAGFPAEVVEIAGGSLPAPDPDEESKPSLTDDDEETALNASLARLAANLTAQLQGAAVELARQQAQAAASQPKTIEGEVANSEPAPALQEADPDPEPAPALQEADPDPEPAQELTVKRQPAPQRGPRRDAKGRITTSLGYGGSRPDDRVGSYRTFH